MRRLICILLCMLCASAAFAAESTTFFAMDTVMTLNVQQADDELIQACIDRVMALEGLFSVTDPSSEIARLNAGYETALSEDTRLLLDFALSMCEETGGALDITMYPVVRAWGFTTGEYRVPDNEELTVLLARTGYAEVSPGGGAVAIPEGMMVDLGSVAKGYASDVLTDMLRQNGMTSGLMDLGGNIYCIGSKADGSAWKIAIRSPLGEGYAGALSVSDCAVVTSGAYERCFEAEDGTVYGHIFDPRTGYPVDNGILSVTVIGKSGTLCDALSTALYVMGPEKASAYLKERTDVDAIILCADERIIATQTIDDSFIPLGEFMDWKMEWVER